MSVICDICGKTAKKASKLSFSHKHNVYRQMPNLQPVKIVLANGTVKRAKVCTSCIRKGNFTKAV